MLRICVMILSTTSYLLALSFVAFADYIDPDDLRSLSDIKVCKKSGLRYLVRRFISLEFNSYMQTKARSETECAYFCYSKTSMCRAATFDEHSGLCRFSHYPFSCSGPGLLSGPTFLRVGKRTIQCLRCEGDPATPAIPSNVPEELISSPIMPHIESQSTTSSWGEFLAIPSKQPKAPLRDATKPVSEVTPTTTIAKPTDERVTVLASTVKKSEASRASNSDEIEDDPDTIQGVKIVAHSALGGDSPSVTLWYPSTTASQLELQKFLTRISPGQTLSVVAVTKRHETTTPIPTTTTQPPTTSTPYFARWLLPFHYQEPDLDQSTHSPTVYPYEKVREQITRIRDHFRKIQQVRGIPFNVPASQSESPVNRTELLNVDRSAATDEDVKDKTPYFPFDLFYKDRDFEGAEKGTPGQNGKNIRFKPSRPVATIVTIASASYPGYRHGLNEEHGESSDVRGNGTGEANYVISSEESKFEPAPSYKTRILSFSSREKDASDVKEKKKVQTSSEGVTVIFGRAENETATTPKPTTTTKAPQVRRKPTRKPTWLSSDEEKPTILPGMNGKHEFGLNQTGGPSEELDKYGVSVALQEVMAAAAVGPPFAMSGQPRVVQPYGHCLAGALLPCSFGVTDGCEIRQVSNGCWHCVCSYKGPQKGCFGSPYLSRDSWADLLYGRRKCRNGRRAQSVYRYYRKKNDGVDQCVATKHPYCGFSEDTIMHKMPKTLDECQTLCFGDKKHSKND